ncbi:hypothetical protein CSE_07660 [Caldisericum exile AZM16c01]|uniref:Uncharacterized protein n=1 Tax=Caldisericum exile (strain DSM 21853 / NBRC 104410 / AZM16c01) TaxID=511051 RepID=A0A7U6GEK6_CALEA|nr:hypothetical protein CSE_07660 [Caldisericum exile AZM16c01]
MITIFVFLILVALLFNITEVQVFDETLNVPISGVKVNNFLTNEQGVSKFLDISFNQFITLERIGYQTTKVKIGIKPLYRVAKVNLSEADSNYIREQINNWENGISNYRYELTTSKTDYSYTFIQVINGDDKYTKTITNQNGQITETEIFVISGRVYIRENGGQIQEITENKEDFISNNLILIPLADVINEFFSAINGNVVFESPSKLIFASNNAQSVLTLILSNEGTPSKFILENSNQNSKEVITLTIDLSSTEVSFSEK